MIVCEMEGKDDQNETRQRWSDLQEGMKAMGSLLVLDFAVRRQYRRLWDGKTTCLRCPRLKSPP